MDVRIEQYKATWDRCIGTSGVAGVCQALGLDTEKNPNFLTVTGRFEFLKVTLCIRGDDPRVPEGQQPDKPEYDADCEWCPKCYDHLGFQLPGTPAVALVWPATALQLRQERDDIPWGALSHWACLQCLRGEAELAQSPMMEWF